MLFETTKKESRKTAWMRRLFNVFPCIWCAGGKVTFISGDYQELHVKLALNLRTRNRVGTVFGGSIYSSVDPYFMLLFMDVLGKEYVVWDKAASVKFVRPITGQVKCRFLISDELVAQVKKEIAERGEYTFELPLKYEDDKGAIYAVFTKTIYAASKEFYKAKLKKREELT